MIHTRTNGRYVNKMSTYKFRMSVSVLREQCTLLLPSNQILCASHVLSICISLISN